jgi:hypothetical protein
MNGISLTLALCGGLSATWEAARGCAESPIAREPRPTVYFLKVSPTDIAIDIQIQLGLTTSTMDKTSDRWKAQESVSLEERKIATIEDTFTWEAKGVRANPV